MPIQQINPVKSTQFNSPPAQPANAKPKAGSMTTTVVLLLVAIVAIAGCAWLYVKYTAVKKQASILATPQGQQQMAQKEVQALLDKLGKLIVLPTGEEPTVATITDAGSLKKEQPFYKDAEDGDKVIVYMQAKKAIIYNEAKNILVNVGPIFVNESATTSPAEEGAEN